MSYHSEQQQPASVNPPSNIRASAVDGSFSERTKLRHSPSIGRSQTGDSMHVSWCIIRPYFMNRPIDYQATSVHRSISVE